MPVFYPNVGALWMAGEVGTLLAVSEMHLFQSTIVPDVNTVLADLVAEEADFTGYADIALTVFGAPYLVPVGGAAVNSPAVQFNTGDPTTVANTIGGAWIQTAGGDLVLIDVFPTPIAMDAPGKAIPIQEILRFLSGL
jgi:hypothetical protein